MQSAMIPELVLYSVPESLVCAFVPETAYQHRE